MIWPAGPRLEGSLRILVALGVICGLVVGYIWPFFKGLDSVYKASNPPFVWLGAYTTAVTGMFGVVTIGVTLLLAIEDIARWLHNKVVIRILQFCDIVVSVVAVLHFLLQLLPSQR